MPTYQNRSSDFITLGDNFSISPGKTLITEQQYVNVHRNPSIYKIYEEPRLRNDFFEIFTNINTTAGWCAVLDFTNSFILHIKDGNTPTLDGSEVEITAFCSITDLVKDFIPIKTFRFTKKSYLDFSNSPISLWSCDISNKIPHMQIDSYHEFITFAITYISIGSGTINVLLKPY